MHPLLPKRKVSDSDGVSRLGLGLETCPVSRDPVFHVSVSKVSGLVSVSKDFGLGLELFVTRLHRLFFMKFYKEFLKKRF